MFGVMQGREISQLFLMETNLFHRFVYSLLEAFLLSPNTNRPIPPPPTHRSSTYPFPNSLLPSPLHLGSDYTPNNFLVK
jgi:hypothetical protein